MNLSQLNEGDIIQFVTRVNASGHDEPIQHVILKISEVTSTYIRGINSCRSLDNGEITYRTYRVDNIVKGTLWRKIG